ncbi:hypothetical protein [Kosmotoga pacifica]|uniref:Yip1 domain-containing protein n=1 Tax=Kosmotoga pacifica TaxID=1330330 RepID=A0A0G2ZFQ9_9BACT|nr:hypothetical protein [Kosmotoga pacifica]AKI97618.1 hypothetical protein IX53_07080 [Kosmotoga pacifica]
MELIFDTVFLPKKAFLRADRRALWLLPLISGAFVVTFFPMFSMFSKAMGTSFGVRLAIMVALAPIIYIFAISTVYKRVFNDALFYSILLCYVPYLFTPLTLLTNERQFYILLPIGFWSLVLEWVALKVKGGLQLKALLLPLTFKMARTALLIWLLFVW